MLAPAALAPAKTSGGMPASPARRPKGKIRPMQNPAAKSRRTGLHPERRRPQFHLWRGLGRLAGRLAGALADQASRSAIASRCRSRRARRRSSSSSTAPARRDLPAAQHRLHADRARLLRRRCRAAVIVATPARRGGDRRARRSGTASARRCRSGTAGDGTLMEARAPRSRAEFAERRSAGTTSSPSSTPRARPAARRARC